MKSLLKVLLLTSVATMLAATMAIAVGQKMTDEIADVGSAVMETLAEPPTDVVLPDGGATAE